MYWQKCKFKNNRSCASTTWNKERAVMKLLKSQMPGKESEDNHREWREKSLEGGKTKRGGKEETVMEEKLMNRDDLETQSLWCSFQIGIHKMLWRNKEKERKNQGW